MSERLKALTEAGVSIWLDDLSRERLQTGNLAELVRDSFVVGCTTNPTIFAASLGTGERYDEQVAALVEQGKDVDEVIFDLTTTDVRDACDVFMDTWKATDGVDGRVSIEVPPGIAYDTEASTEMANRLWHAVDRPNLFIKIPATAEGAPAIAATLAEGVSVNVTLIFGLDRYKGVMDAFLEGMDRARANGKDLSQTISVASFFVSRVDTEIDKRLDALDDPAAAELKGKAGIANARLAYQLFEEVFSDDRFLALKAAGAREQRPLWASTGVKNPDYRDTMYVTDLVVPNTVNTMPEKTMHAFADHGEVRGDQVTGHYAEAQQVMDDLAAVGVDYDDVIATLEREGIEKFEKSWDELVATVEQQIAKSKDAAR